MGCFWVTNPTDMPDVPGLDPSKTMHCADCNWVDCAAMGGTWMPVSCDFFNHFPLARRVYETIPCPYGIDSNAEIGYCCIRDGESCIAHGPWVGEQEWCDEFGGTWIDMDDWPGGSGISPQAWATQQCEKICSKIVIIEEANRGFEPSIPKEEVDKFISDAEKLFDSKQVSEENLRSALETMPEEALEKLLEVLQTTQKEPTRTPFNGPWKMRGTDGKIKQYYKDDIVTWAGKTYKVIADVKAKHPSNTPSSFLLIEDKNAPINGGLF